jgi:hypothetical protein
MRNYIKEDEIISILEWYKTRYFSSKSWETVCREAGISRKAYYAIRNSEEQVKRSTVIKLCKSLHMNYQDFVTVYEFNGFTIRQFKRQENEIMLMFLGNDNCNAHRLSA